MLKSDVVQFIGFIILFLYWQLHNAATKFLTSWGYHNYKHDIIETRRCFKIHWIMRKETTMEKLSNFINVHLKYSSHTYLILY